MTKPGRRRRTPSDEIAHFTDREDQQELFRRSLHSAVEPSVLVFYGVGGAGKTWLLKRLRAQVPPEVPTAFLDFDRAAGGRRFVFDPPAALYEIRQQLGRPTPRFDLAFGVLRVKQGAAPETGLLTELAAELLGTFVPGAGVVLKRLSLPLTARLKGTPLEDFLAKSAGQKFVLELRRKTTQEIGGELLNYLDEDLSLSIAPRLNRAVSAVLFFDTFEAIGSEAQNEEHKFQYEQWIREVASNFGFALKVIAGQNRLTWDEVDPEWNDCLDQHLVGGLSETDAQLFLNDCGIDDRELQDAILATAREESGAHHCFSLGLCVDIVDLDRGRGQRSDPNSLRFAPQDWEKLARRFLKSLTSDAEGRWIRRLSLTPQFDEAAARKAFSDEHSAAQDAAWENLPAYSFVGRLIGSEDWFAIRTQMRWALENQPSAHGSVKEDHGWWQQYWISRAKSQIDRAASLAWYHHYSIEPNAALKEWDRLVETARYSEPPRMSEHSALLQWWEPVGLLDSPCFSEESAKALLSLAYEYYQSSVGDRSLNLRYAIAAYEGALHVYTEAGYPKIWANTQNNLGNTWGMLQIGDEGEHLQRAINHFEAALRVHTEKDFPNGWATLQSNLGSAWNRMPAGDPEINHFRAIAYYEAALRVYTEHNSPHNWAMTQHNLGSTWIDISIGDRTVNLRRAVSHLEAALRAFTEAGSPAYYVALSRNRLGEAWRKMPIGDPEENFRRAIEYHEAALCGFPEQDFPQEWAMTQEDLGHAWKDMPSGDRSENLRRAIAYYEAALRVLTEQSFPLQQKITLENLTIAREGLSSLSSQQPSD
jgi:tetratricopeptide (TPR) repeat protein